jgi:hypothetical protein
MEIGAIYIGVVKELVKLKIMVTFKHQSHAFVNMVNI